MLNFTAWWHEAIREYCTLLTEFKDSAQQEKKKLKKNPPVYINRLINDLLNVFSKQVLAKLAQHKQKKLDEDSVGWANSIALISIGPKNSFDFSALVGDGTVTRRATFDLGNNNSPGALSDSDSQDSGGGGEKKQQLLLLPDINNRTQLTTAPPGSAGGTAASRRARAKKLAEQVPKEPTQEEIIAECYNIVAAKMSKLVCAKQRSPLHLCAVSTTFIK
jgi:hypothetical protein